MGTKNYKVLFYSIDQDTLSYLHVDFQVLGNFRL